jgi:hypothetical protein
MSVASKYWQLVKIDAAGERKIQEFPAAKAFFTEYFGEFTTTDDISHIDVQRHLIKKYRDAKSESSQLAERCLLCFISWQIEKVCLELAARFRENYGFNCSDLLPYVLEDNGRLPRPGSSYKCFSLEILQSFNSQQSSLAIWTNIKVKQHPRLIQFLLECGVYLISDWAILNDSQPKQLERILEDFHCLTQLEIQEAKNLLEAYHAVYLTQRIKQGTKGMTGRCPAPTPEQLKEIALYIQGIKKNQATHLQSGVNLFYTDDIMTQLQNIAAKLRQYRIHVRGGSLATESLNADAIERIPYHEVENSWENQKQEAEFLKFYQQQFLACLEQALAMVTESRVKEIGRKDNEKARKFVIALHLFHCQKLSMTEIAKELKLRAQDAVTRLLKLKDFRADVRQQMLILLRNIVQDKVRIYSSIENLQKFENQITLVLNEQISKVFEDAEIQSRYAKNIFINNVFIEKLCKYLESKN